MHDGIVLTLTTFYRPSPQDVFGLLFHNQVCEVTDSEPGRGFRKQLERMPEPGSRILSPIDRVDQDSLKMPKAKRRTSRSYLGVVIIRAEVSTSWAPAYQSAPE